MAGGGVMAHTPGPWAITDDGVGVFSANMPLHQNKVIANCGAVAREREENEANARLIAATPDLLVALHASVQCISDLLDVYGRGCSMVVLDEAVKSCRDDALKLARAALKKAVA